MILIDNIDCKLLQIDSDYLEAIIALGQEDDIETITVETKVNCCPDLYTEETASCGLQALFTCVGECDDYQMLGIYFLNVLTGEIVETTNGPYADARTNTSGTDMTNWMNDASYSGMHSAIGINQAITTITNYYSETYVPYYAAYEKDGEVTKVYFECPPVYPATEYTSQKVIRLGSKIYMYPQYFNGATTFPDGLYSIKVTVELSNGGNSTEENCFMADCGDLKCRIAKYMVETKDTDPALIHYSLTESNNCGCNCENACELYEHLNTLLNKENGCTSC